jgi:tRNA(fMet)-specific endonuclease VapC
MVALTAIVDTSILIDLLRDYPPAKAWMQMQSPQQLAITPIVWMETIQGAKNKISRERSIKLLQRFMMTHPTEADNHWAMQQYTRYFLSHGMQYSDVMIASVAVGLQIPLYTLNLKHYTPLPDVDEQRPY